MKLTAVVPAKAFTRGKTRLAPALDAPARARLARGMLAHVLETLRASPSVGDVVVVTDGHDVERLARACGARALRDRGEPPLRIAVDFGLGQVAASNGVLVVMADLPWLTADDVERVTGALSNADVVIAPDAPRLGTNALALSAHARMPTAFGSPTSFADHLARAAERALRAVVVDSPTLAFDVDTPADLDNWVRRRSSLERRRDSQWR